MPSINLLIKRLERDYPDFTYNVADEFWWAANTQTVHYNPTMPHCREYTLHELSHAILGHSGYEFDIDLIKMERDAWRKAQEIAPDYGIAIDEEITQDNLETYRTWLHARSVCPSCETTGMQTKNQHYYCLSCGQSWRANEARLCNLRRYTISAK
jgi:hypothetical protein